MFIVFFFFLHILPLFYALYFYICIHVQRLVICEGMFILEFTAVSFE